MSFDRNNQADLTALKAEVTNDPLAIGYSYLSGGAKSAIATTKQAAVSIMAIM